MKEKYTSDNLMKDLELTKYLPEKLTEKLPGVDKLRFRPFIHSSPSKRFRSKRARTHMKA